MTSLIGQSLGRYHILEQLGEGGMAVVYKAFDTRLERNVAVKVILPGKEHSEKFLKRFEREAKALAQLSHPNIVKVLDYGDYEGVPYLVMEYLHGGTLKQKLSGRTMSWKEAIRIIIPVARALGYAHQHRIIHRDVKPSNILITDAGDPMVSDFGIAKILEVDETMDLTGTGVGLGTPEYMSPEQAQGKQVDARSDIYSLGVVLYELVTGRKPYQADTPMAVVWKLASEPLPRPSMLNKDVPEVVENILIKALSKNPDDRFKDTDSFITVLENVIAGTRIPEEKKTPKAPGTSYRFWAMGIGSVVLFAMMGWFAFTALNRMEPNAPSGVSTPAFVSTSEGVTSESASTNVNNPVVPSTPSLHDDFNEATYNGSFNRQKWEAAGDCSSVSQENGSLVFRSKDEGCDLYVLSANSGYTYLSDPSWLEAKVRIEDDFQGNVATQELQFITDKLPGNGYWILCGIQVDGSGTRLFFDVNNYGKDDAAEYRQEFPAEPGKWYTLHLAIDSKTMTTSCTVDGEVLGSYVPAEAALLRKVEFRRVVEAARGSNASMTSAVDDVRISPSNLTEPSSDIYLMDLTPVEARAERDYLGYGVYPWSEGPMLKGEPMFMLGRFYDHSIFAHAVSALKYDIGGMYQRLETQVYYFGPCQPIVDGAVFRIFGDNKLLYESPSLEFGDPAIPLDISLAGVDQLLLTTDPLSNVSCDWTIWFEPVLTPAE